MPERPKRSAAPVESDRAGRARGAGAASPPAPDIGRGSVRAEEGGGRVTIAVSDTGVGIAPEAHELIFEPFRQVGAGTVRGNGGTGLGLAICERLVLFDGVVRLERCDVTVGEGVWRAH